MIEYKFTVHLNCPDCGVKIDQPHESGCDIERCSVCKMQWIGCGHRGHKPMQERWMGIWPDEIEAVGRGWFTEDGQADLNRMARFRAFGFDKDA
jgi:hypothetical protein